MTQPLFNNLSGEFPRTNDAVGRGASTAQESDQSETASCDPPVVVGSESLSSFQASSTVAEMIQQWDAAANKRLNAKEVYGVPRVFDLFTLMAITMAFALLFALLKLVSPAFNISATTLTILISGYVTLIAVAQMVLFGGDNPRMASVVAGPFSLLSICMAFWIPSSGLGVTMTLVLSLFLSILFGFFLGYLSGAVVAGVLLVADGFRGRSAKAMRLSAQLNRDVGFDEIE